MREIAELLKIIDSETRVVSNHSSMSIEMCSRLIQVKISNYLSIKKPDHRPSSNPNINKQNYSQ